MGLSYLVYPEHTIPVFIMLWGVCIFLFMQKALKTLIDKGVPISNEEEEATLIAILLHDIGHGPFSHALEHSIIKKVSQ